MHKISSLVFCALSIHLAYGQFALPGSGSSSSAYPRIKLAGPLGQLIGGQGISLNSGLGQVLSSMLTAAGGGGGGGEAPNTGHPLQQLATAASTQYINAIRSLPFGQSFGGSQQSQQQPQQPQQYGGHGQFNGPSGHNMYNPMNFLTPDNNLYGGQGNFDHGHFGPNSFPHFPQSENYFGNQGYGGYNQGPSSSLYNGGAPYGNNGHMQGHQLDK